MNVLQSYQERLWEGARLSFELSIYSLLLSLVLGMLICLAGRSPKRFWRYPAQVYTTVIRGVPDLVQLFLLYYGGQYFLNYLSQRYGWQNLEMTPFWTGVMALGVVFSAYMAEAFRGGFQSIPKGQIEAAQAYGFAPNAIFWRIALPQMLRYALPSLGNNWLVLMKNSSLVSIIGLKDLVAIANMSARSVQQRDVYAAFWFYAAVAAFFLVMTTVSIILLHYLQKHYDTGFKERRA